MCIRDRPYTQRLRWRVRLLWLAIAAMLVYMVVVAELGGGDSRKITRFADMVSDILFFGGLVWLGCRIARTQKLLKNQQDVYKRQAERLQEKTLTKTGMHANMKLASYEVNFMSGRWKASGHG